MSSAAGPGERLLAPRVPVDRVVGVLAQVRAGLVGEAVHVATGGRASPSSNRRAGRAPVAQGVEDAVELVAVGGGQRAEELRDHLRPFAPGGDEQALTLGRDREHGDPTIGRVGRAGDETVLLERVDQTGDRARRDVDALLRSRMRCGPSVSVSRTRSRANDRPAARMRSLTCQRSRLATPNSVSARSLGACSLTRPTLGARSSRET